MMQDVLCMSATHGQRTNRCKTLQNYLLSSMTKGPWSLVVTLLATDNYSSSLESKPRELQYTHASQTLSPVLFDIRVYFVPRHVI